MSILTRRDTAPRRMFQVAPFGWFDRDLGELFDQYLGSMASEDAHVPRLNVAETEAVIEVTTEVPGMKADEIDIEVADNVLTIVGEHTEEETKENGKKFHRVERRTGSFSRSVRLPCAVDERSVEAELAEGVLTVTLPKQSDVRPCKVQIKG